MTAERHVSTRSTAQSPRSDGLVPKEEWTATAVHKASTYACGKCGAPMESPHDLYDHLDREHPDGDRG